MTLTSLGRVAVPIPGTPVTLPAPVNTRVARLIFQAAPTNTGKTYFGLNSLNKLTLTGVSRVFTTTEIYEIATEDGTDGISISQLAIDADVVGDGLLVSYWTE